MKEKHFFQLKIVSVWISVLLSCLFFSNTNAWSLLCVPTIINYSRYLTPQSLKHRPISPQYRDLLYFQDDEMCGSNSNTFYELSAVQNNLLLTDSIIIGGQRRAVTKIMAYKRQWFLNNWYNPMLTFAERLAGLANGHSRHSQTPAVGFRSSNYRYNTFPEPMGSQSNNSDCCCCTIL